MTFIFKNVGKNMRHTVISLFTMLISLTLLFGNTAYGIWIPESPHDLLEKSATIFVGNITSTKVLQFEKQWSELVSENGTDKTITRNYTLNLDDYTVNIEEYLKNPQNSTEITVRQPTIGLMHGLGGTDEFKTGDHVLFYIESLDGNNTYSPESFIIPIICNAQDVITQKRPAGGNELNVTQNGIQIDYGNFTANEPITFLYSKDMETLSGKSLDVSIEITNNSNNEVKTVFSKEIHTGSKPCEWVAKAEWEFTPQDGNYMMHFTTKDEGGSVIDTSDTGFSVKSEAESTSQISPLKQFQSGIAANKVTCEQGLEIIQKIEDGSPACVTPTVANILIERGWGHLP